MQVTPRTDQILILDFGAQYTQLIARRVRECQVFCEILPFHTPVAEICARKPKGIILSGGPSSVYEADAPKVDPAVFELGVPILGICYGHQLMSLTLGGVVTQSTRKEFGGAMLTVVDDSPIFAGLGCQLDCWMSHGDTVKQPPPGFRVLAVTDNTPVAAMANDVRKFYGVQFHPEVAHTPFGKQLLQQFCTQVCGCAQDWNATSIAADAIQEIKETVGSAKVVCGVSGGIDSAVVAALVHQAIGDQLTCIFVDHGLLRLGEADQVVQDFRDALGIHLIHVDARERFLARLAGVTDPETKRKIIGEEFVRVFEENADNINGVEYLAQGTLYPDVIESGTSTAATIKTHHNVGGLPEDMWLRVLEPLKLLFKDEARAVARELGLPETITGRHPFPGPGLAIRILGEVTEERLELLRRSDAIFIEELRASGWYDRTWQAFAALIANAHSVGVMGDSRTYAHPVVLRAVTSDDAMTAQWAHLPYELLDKVSRRIVNEVPGVNRVVYDVSSKPPATIEWE